MPSALSELFLEILPQDFCFYAFQRGLSVPHKCLSWAKAPGGTENSESLGREDEYISFLFSMGQYFTESPMKQSPTCSGSNIVSHSIYGFIPFLSHAPIYSLGSYDWNPRLMVSFGKIEWTNQVMGETQKMTSVACDFYSCQATHIAECQNNSNLEPSQPKLPCVFAMISLQ